MRQQEAVISSCSLPPFRRVLFGLLAILTLALPAPPARAGTLEWLANGLIGRGSSIESLLAADTVDIEGCVLPTPELRRFYAERKNRPAWNADPKNTARPFKSFLDSLDAFADFHGLPHEPCPSGALKALAARGLAEDQDRVDILLTARLLGLARQLRGEALDLKTFYEGWRFERPPLDPVPGLLRAVEGDHVKAFIESLAPARPAYLRLAAALKVWREKAAQMPAWPGLKGGGILRPGERDPRFRALRARLEAEGYAPAAPPPDGQQDLYDPDLQEALKSWQRAYGLKPDGLLGPHTVAMLNIPPTERVDQILANMERQRHMPDVMPARYTVVNIADASIRVVGNERTVYEGPTIVGRVDRKTPFIQSAIRSVIFNPAWHVPAKIARKDILPRLRKDPHYLEKMGFVIKEGADPHGAAVDWNRVRESAFNFRLRQSPGELNSLGRLKFDFDNDFAVYLHGTPHRELFEKDERALSSGCVRLQDPEIFATLLLVANEGVWDEARVREEIDKGKTRWLRVADPLPLFIVYETVFAAPDGTLRFRHDLYGHDALLMEKWRERWPDAAPAQAAPVTGEPSPPRQ